MQLFVTLEDEFKKGLTKKNYRLEILFFVICLWSVHLNLSIPFRRSFACLVALPCTLLRHILKLESFIWLRIMFIVCCSEILN